MTRNALLALSLTLLACAGPPTTDTPAPDAQPETAMDTLGEPPQHAAAATALEQPAPDAAIERRPFAPTMHGEPILAAISYGPYREGQRPGGPFPSDAEMEEDLRIIAEHWHMLRVYGSGEPTERILRIIRDEELPLVVLLGAWIAADGPEANAAEVGHAIRLANAYPEQVVAVNVGNETQVFWSAHRSPIEELVGHIRTVRAAIAQPVTTADDYNFWNKLESDLVAAEVDFLLLHAYAMWNQQQLDDAVEWTADIVASIEAIHPELDIVIGETGWATELNPEGSEVQYIHAPAGEAEQARFYTEFTAWAAEAEQPYFFFEAFDEPWKGSDDPREVEKHWGLFFVDRTPKLALQGAAN